MLWYLCLSTKLVYWELEGNKENVTSWQRRYQEDMNNEIDDMNEDEDNLSQKVFSKFH